MSPVDLKETAPRPARDAGAAFHFGIALKSRQVARDWQQVTELLRGTLQSLFNQTCGEFTVMIACHEVPEVPELSDPRIELLRVSFPVPVVAVASSDAADQRYRPQLQDKFLKQRALAVRLRERGGGDLMFLDADDRVHKRLVEHVRTSAAPYGHVLRTGYEYDAGAGRIRWVPSFDKICGSCAVLRFAREDLPERLDDEAEVAFNVVTRRWHPSWAAVSAELGRPLQPVPFRSCMYVLNTGENLSGIRPQSFSWRRKFSRLVLPTWPPSRRLREAFAL